MFTGLVEDTAPIEAVVRGRDHVELVIRPGRFAARELALGDSVAVDGVCLTVTSIDPADGDDGSFRVLAGAETLARTALGELAAGSPVHLERAVRVGDRLGGHLVQGHVDGIAVLVDRRDQGANLVLELEPPADLLRYVVAKGSVALDGVSLTVNRVGETTFEVALVPHTVQLTGLGALQLGARLNLEVDIIAKYVERLTLAHRGAGPAAVPGDPA